MVQDYDGTAVIDATGEEIGTVERSYVDDSGAVRMVSIKMGRMRAKHRLVPVDDLRPEDDALRIPYTKRVVEDAPDVDADDALEGEALERVRAYYGRMHGRPPHDARTQEERQAEPDRPVVEERQAEARDAAAMPADAGQETRQVRDRDEVVEVPIVEEELVKRPVVKESLRIRKNTATDRQQVEEGPRKEDVEIDREGDVEPRGEDQRRS